MGIKSFSGIKIVKGGHSIPPLTVAPIAIQNAINSTTTGTLPFVVDVNRIINLTSKSPIDGRQPYAEFWEWQNFFDEYKDEIYFLKNIEAGFREIKTPADQAKLEKMVKAGFVDVTEEKKLLRKIQHCSVTDKGRRIIKWQEDGLPLPLRHEIPPEFLHRYSFSGPNLYAEVMAGGRKVVSYFRHETGYEIDDNYLSFMDLDFDEVHPEYFGRRMTSDYGSEEAIRERSEKALEMISSSSGFLRSYPIFMNGENGAVTFSVPVGRGKPDRAFTLDASLWNYYREKYGHDVHILIPSATLQEQERLDDLSAESRDRIRKTGNIMAGAGLGLALMSDRLLKPLMVMKDNETVGVINVTALRKDDCSEEIANLYH